MGLGESLGITPDRDRIAAALVAAQNGHALAALDELRMVRADADRMTEYVVMQLRARFKSWAFIGDALGVSGQAAHKKYRHLG